MKQDAFLKHNKNSCHPSNSNNPKIAYSNVEHKFWKKEINQNNYRNHKTMLSLDSCTSSCGYAAIAVASLCFGSFSVPMKSEAAKAVDIDPLVFQTYKTFMYLVIALILVIFGMCIYIASYSNVFSYVFLKFYFLYFGAFRSGY